MRLILPAAMIPEGTKVYKPTGEKPYTLTRNIKIFGDGRPPINADEGIVFLWSDGAINIVFANKELAIELDKEEMIQFLERL